MRNASDAFIYEVTNGRAVTRADVTLSDGAAIAFEPTDMMQGQLSVTSGSSSSSSFDIGAAIMGQCTFSVHNEQRQYNQLRFDGAEVIPQVGALVDGEYEWHQLGVYHVEPIDQYGEILTLQCVDDMSRFERLYANVKTAYPATLGRIVADVCAACGVDLATKAFPHYDYEVSKRGVDAKASCLEVIGWAAQAAGCFAHMDHLGRLQLRWYDVNSFTPEGGMDGGGFHFEVDSADGGGFHYDVDDNDYNGGAFIDPRGLTDIKTVKASITAHEVTGLSVTEQKDGSFGSQRLTGTDGYVLHVQSNPLIEDGRGEAVAANIWPQVEGMELRNVDVSMLGTPLLEAGDPVTVTDRHGETYHLWATNVKWSSSGSLSVSSGVKASSPYERVDRTSQRDIQSDINALRDIVSDISPGNISTTLSRLQEAVSDLQKKAGGGSGGGTGGWNIQVNGVTRTSGTINFIT